MNLSIFEGKPTSAKSLSLRKTVYGVGVNDSPFVTQITVDGKKLIHPAYDCWRQMLRRCYSPESLAKKPRYAGCTVSEDWLSFSCFLQWWRDNHVPGWQIDKDILTGSKIYSVGSCIFVPKWVNTIITDSLATRGDLLIGATKHGRDGAIEAWARNTITNKQEYLGRYDSELLANAAWKRRRIEIVDQLKAELDMIDYRLHGRIVKIISERIV